MEDEFVELEDETCCEFFVSLLVRQGNVSKLSLLDNERREIVDDACVGKQKKDFADSRLDCSFTKEELGCDEIKPKFSITGEGIIRQSLDRDVVVDSDDDS